MKKRREKTERAREREREMKKRKHGRKVHFNATMLLMERCKMYTRERERKKG